MKKFILLIIVAVICFIAYFWASPYITVYKIKKGIIEQDSEKLSENIDFPLLRQNLKEQLNASLMKTALSELSANPFQALGIALASKLIDGLLDTFVSPAALSSMMEGRKPLEKGPSTEPSRKEPFRNAKYSFFSLSKFCIRVPADEGEEFRFMLTRTGLSWKLSNIILPLKELESKQTTKGGTPAIKFEIDKWGVQYGYAKVTGKVTNVGNSVAQSVQIKMRISDSSGVLLGEDTAYPVGYSLNPGQSATIEFHCRVSELGDKNYWPPEWSCNYPLTVDNTKAEIGW